MRMPRIRVGWKAVVEALLLLALAATSSLLSR
jgi:hypothetical protein